MSCLEARVKAAGLLLCGASLLAVDPGAFAQQCTTTGGTVITSTTLGCTISVNNSTLTIANPATDTGWLNFTGNNTSLTVNSGGSFVTSDSASGNPFSSGISLSGSNLLWSLTNNGTLTADSAVVGRDLLGIYIAGGTYTITNTGTIQTLGTGGFRTINTNGNSNVKLSITNSGTISSASNQTIYFTGGGAGSSFTLINQAGGILSSPVATPVSLDGNPAVVNITNQGTISSGGNNG